MNLLSTAFTMYHRFCVVVLWPNFRKLVRTSGKVLGPQIHVKINKEGHVPARQGPGQGDNDRLEEQS